MRTRCNPDGFADGRRSTGRRPNRRGFTLIELLIVVAVIALLAAGLMAALAGARERGRTAACASNLRQIGYAVQCFAQANGGRYPESSHTTSLDINKAWINTLGAYLSDTDAVRLCTTDPRGDERMARKGTSFVLNEYVCVPGPGSTVTLDTTPKPSATMFAFEVADTVAASQFSDHTHSRNWFRAPVDQNWTRIRRDIQPDRHDRGASSDGSGGLSNVLFADAHVEPVEAAVLKVRADANDNFALPPLR